MHAIEDVTGLESVVGGRPLAVMLKSIDDLDEHCVRLLELSPAAVVGWREDGGAGIARAALAGGAAGFATAATPTTLRLAVPPGVEPAPGSPVSTLFLVPGLGETLRVNGRAGALGDGALTVEVGEAFVHCAKCVLRSELWTATSTEAVPSIRPESGRLAGEVADLLARAPFAVLATGDGEGGADASPKGDPAGFVRIVDERTVVLPDRPGNRRTDTFHNLVADPAIAVLALVPGEDRVVELSGRARLTDDADLRATMEVNGRQPKVAVVVEVERAWVHDSPAIDAAGLWDLDRRVPQSDLPDAARIWTDHVKRNKAGGLAAKAIRTGANARMLRAGIAADYKRGLY